MRAEVIAVGHELLYGDIVNGNAAWIGQRLAEAGVDLERSCVVGDDVEVIADAIRTALARADAVLLTGGLGPTQDDVTREGIALALGLELERQAELEDALRARFTSMRRDVPEMNYRQADVPRGGLPLPNSRGTAPGLLVPTDNGKVVYAMPGVPHEMHPMLSDHVVPDLLNRAGRPAVVVHRLVRTSGIWESAVAEAMAPEVERLAGASSPVIAFLASGGQTRVKITARGRTRTEALEQIAPVEAFARQALGDAVYGFDDDTLPGVVLAALATRGDTIACAESLTGGTLAALISAEPGASAAFRGGVVAYATDLKESQLGVPAAVLLEFGAISSECAAAMAVGCRERLGSTYALSLTGVAGPAPQEGQPVGTVHLGLAWLGGVQTKALRVPGDRERVRQFAASSALDWVRRWLAEHGPGSV